MREPAVRSETDICWGGRDQSALTPAQKQWMNAMGNRDRTAYGGGSVAGANQDPARGIAPRAENAVSVAKAMTGLATTLAVQEDVQLQGGIDMGDEYDMGFYLKRARVLAEMFGETNFHADKVARAADY